MPLFSVWKSPHIKSQTQEKEVLQKNYEGKGKRRSSSFIYNNNLYIKAEGVCCYHSDWATVHVQVFSN
jgi:hypothetical protein